MLDWRASQIGAMLGLAMNRYPDHPEHGAAKLGAWMTRLARTVVAAAAPVVAELLRLNRIGAGAASRSDRVDAVKQALAHRGEGPNRCC